MYISPKYVSKYIYQDINIYIYICIISKYIQPDWKDNSNQTYRNYSVLGIMEVQLRDSLKPLNTI